MERQLSWTGWGWDGMGWVEMDWVGKTEGRHGQPLRRNRGPLIIGPVAREELYIYS